MVIAYAVCTADQHVGCTSSGVRAALDQRPAAPPRCDDHTDVAVEHPGLIVVGGDQQRLPGIEVDRVQRAPPAAAIHSRASAPSARRPNGPSRCAHNTRWRRNAASAAGVAAFRGGRPWLRASRPHRAAAAMSSGASSDTASRRRRAPASAVVDAARRAPRRPDPRSSPSNRRPRVRRTTPRRSAARSCRRVRAPSPPAPRDRHRPSAASSCFPIAATGRRPGRPAPRPRRPR